MTQTVNQLAAGMLEQLAALDVRAKEIGQEDNQSVSVVRVARAALQQAIVEFGDQEVNGLSAALFKDAFGKLGTGLLAYSKFQRMLGESQINDADEQQEVA